MKQKLVCYSLDDLTLAVSSLLKIFPEADFGTLSTKVTLLNFLQYATYKGVHEQNR